MHANSMRAMAAFVDVFLADLSPGRVADVGAMDVNGSYRELFEDRGWEYVGLDLAPGVNVDVVLDDPYAWRQFPDGCFDVVVSGQTLEHVPYFWLLAREMARVLRDGGLFCLVVPSAGPVHRYPVDCWRFLPDGVKALCAWAGLKVLEVSLSAVGPWKDCRVVAKK